MTVSDKVAASVGLPTPVPGLLAASWQDLRP